MNDGNEISLVSCNVRWQHQSSWKCTDFSKQPGAHEWQRNHVLQHTFCIWQEHELCIVMESFDRDLWFLWIHYANKGSTINNLDINVWNHIIQAFHQVRFAGLVHDGIWRHRRRPITIFAFEGGIHITVSGLTRYVHPGEEMHVILQVAYFGSGLCRFLSWLRYSRGILFLWTVTLNATMLLFSRSTTNVWWCALPAHLGICSWWRSDSFVFLECFSWYYVNSLAVSGTATIHRLSAV